MKIDSSSRKCTFEQKVQNIKDKCPQEQQNQALDIPEMLQHYEEIERQVYGSSNISRASLFISNMQAINDMKSKINRNNKTENDEKNKKSKKITESQLIENIPKEENKAIQHVNQIQHGLPIFQPEDGYQNFVETYQLQNSQVRRNVRRPINEENIIREIIKFRTNMDNKKIPDQVSQKITSILNLNGSPAYICPGNNYDIPIDGL